MFVLFFIGITAVPWFQIPLPRGVLRSRACLPLTSVIGAQPLQQSKAVNYSGTLQVISNHNNNNNNQEQHNGLKDVYYDI